MAGPVATTWGLGLLGLVEVWAGLAGASSFQLEAALWPGLGAWVMELAAVPLPGFGFFSLATPFYIAMLLNPKVGFLPALGLAAGAVLLRSLVMGHPNWLGRLQECLAQLLPLLTTAAAIEWLGPVTGAGLAAVLGLQIYLLAWLQLPRMLAAEALDADRLSFWRKVYGRCIPLSVGVACAGLLLAAFQGPPVWLMLACPVLLALRSSFRAATIEVVTLGQEVLRRRLVRTEQELDAVRNESDRTRQELYQKVDQVALLEELSRCQAEHPDPAQTLDLLLSIAGKLVGCQSAAIFRPWDQNLIPERFYGPHAQRLASSQLLGVSEPCVDQAWRSGCLQIVSRDASPRLLSGETGLALPMGPEGVLYVGDARRVAFSPEEIEQLRTLATQGGLCLRCAHYLARLQHSLADHAQANENLHAWTAGMDRVMESTQGLHSTLNAQAVDGLLREGVQAVAPHDFFWCWRGEAPDQDQAGLLEVAQAVMAGGRPVLYGDLQETRFAQPAGPLRSLAAVPWLDPGSGSAVGAVLVGSPAPGEYSRLTLDLLTLLVYQAGAAWQNAEAYRRLQASEAHLVQAAKMAAVGQLAAGIAHELNSPLAAVLMGIDGALKKPERARERLEGAARAATRAQTIISRLLFYSREGTLEAQLLNLNEVVQDTLQMVSHQLALDGLEVEWDQHPLPVVLGNASELQQVALNLLLNARDAAQDPQARPGPIRLTTDSPDGQSVFLRVRDFGPGVIPEVLERIFEPFFTTKPVGKGTGLGLSLSLEIARRHGGDLRVESSPQGASFTLCLPAQRSAC